ncbi:hypothetical protein FGG08_002892 [Glutinoglossum americanum]|uniref:Uncharacterized protein n=1 Tax=Glutinoglossum americanum TaxID=1670608 RepID=A0A9P8L452_9PEZI|nr:hypothetical protein FGG08_002892 [Glutinoglossum americanum]
MPHALAAYRMPHALAAYQMPHTLAASPTFQPIRKSAPTSARASGSPTPTPIATLVLWSFGHVSVLSVLPVDAAVAVTEEVVVDEDVDEDVDADVDEDVDADLDMLRKSAK